MLKRVGVEPDESGAAVRIREAHFPEPFHSGLEYGAPARGTWNIVHTGMLIPGSHQIYVCAANCLRGVVLTAAEMGAEDRFSTVTIKENNVLEGDMEELIVEGVTDILNRLPKMPPAVLIFTSCIHHFMGCDLPLCFSRLRERFPQTTFTDCYMNPIMRKSGLTPDQLMRRQLYSLLEKKELDARSVNIIGNDLPTDETSDLVQLIRKAGFTLRDITLCKTYAEYQDMAKSALNISYNAAACAGGDLLEERLHQRHLFLPLTYTADAIRKNMTALASVLGTEYDSAPLEAAAEAALRDARALIGDTAIALDYTATMAPISLARLLVEHGFRVERIYADAYSELEREDFEWLQKNAPEITMYATVQVKMRVLPRTTSEKMLAIGQKAAYFTGTRNFVNIVEGGGMYGFDGIRRMAELMKDAFLHERDASGLIQQKGLGCSCCL
jgi:hypothetical protein